MNQTTEDRTWVVRIALRQGGHPEFIGPLTEDEASDLTDRLYCAGRSYESAPLVTEADLPGLWT